MEVFIYGTNEGFNRMFETDSDLAYFVAKELRKGTQGAEQLGQFAYSLAFLNGGCVYSKIVIVKDSLKAFRTGNIAFSLFLRNDEKMKAVDILGLLNELYKWYDSNYIKDHCLNKGETILVKEDWSYVNEILKKYKTEPRSEEVQELNSGSLDPAFIYYKDEKELLNYFDKPYQEEYSEYSQVFFVDERLRGIEDPLNVLKNCGRELKDIELDNDAYFLSNFHSNEGLSILANNKPRTGRKGENSIRKNDWIVISYNRDERYYKSFKLEGTLSDNTSSIKNYFYVNGNQLIIKWEELKKNANPKENSITFRVVDRKGKPVEGVKLICTRPNKDPKQFTSYTTTFDGEEFRQEWKVSVKKDNNYFLDEQPFVPERNNPEFKLREYRVVLFKVVDSAAPDKKIKNFKIRINEEESVPEREFFDEKIYQKHKVFIQCEGYNDLRKSFCPATDKPEFKLNKKESSKGILTDSFKLLKKPRLIAGLSILFFALMATFAWLIYTSNKPPKVPLHQINEYVQGVELNDDTLKAYEASVNYQLSQLDTSSSNSFGNMFARKKEYRDSSKIGFSDSLNNTKDRLDNASLIRSAIKNGDINKLRQLDYYSKQEKFKNAISIVDSRNYEDVALIIKNQYADNLDKLADAIMQELGTELSSQESSKKSDDESGNKSDAEIKKEQLSAKSEPEQTNKSQDATAPMNSKSTKEQNKSGENKDFERKLSSGEITIDDLKTSIDNEAFSKYRKSIKLYLKFWTICADDRMQKTQLDKLLVEVKNDDYLKNSELKSFLSKVCNSQDSFNRFKDTISGLSRSINELTQSFKQ